MNVPPVVITVTLQRLVVTQKAHLPVAVTADS